MSPTGRGPIPVDDAQLLAGFVQAEAVHAIVLLDIDGRVRTWSDAATRCTGYERDEAIGCELDALTPPEYDERSLDFQLAVASADGCLDTEGWRRRKDGAVVWLALTITAVRGESGRLDGFGVVLRDLTERKRAEDLLRDSEARMALLVRAVSDYAIFLLDTEGKVASWNLGAERLKGYRTEEIIGRHLSTFYTDADRRAQVPWRALEEALEKGRWESEGWRVRKDGTRFWANVVITSLRADDGTHLGFTKVTRDLTERKRGEDALRGVLDRERQAAEKLRELDQAKTEFVASVAHDLRSPVGVLRTLLQLLDADWDTAEESHRRNLLERARRRSEQLTVFVEEVFDLARLDAGALDVRAIEIDMGAIAHEVASDQAVLSPDREVRVEVVEPAGALGDPQRSWQVIANLVSNATKFSPPDTAVAVRVAPVGLEVVVSVSDTGPGVPAGEQDQLFERFKRLSNASGTPGSGLGLTIARSLAEAQHGRLWLERTGAEGSTFSFSLPAAT